MARSLFGRRSHRKVVEREKVVRIEKAETELFDLKIRAARAIRKLDDRNKRNHWRHAIEEMIQGTASL